MLLAFYRDNARWLIGGFLLTLFSAFGQTFFISIFGAEIRETFELSHGQFGSVYMVATLASALSLPFVGRVVDHASVALCATASILILAVAAGSMALIQSVPLLVVSIYLLRLFGQGMMGHIALTAMGRWYSLNRGKAVSFSSIGHQASEAMAPILFVTIALAVGWRNAWLVAAAILVLVALPAIVLLMRVERVARSDAATVARDNEVGRQWRRSEVMRDPLFWLMCCGILSPAFIGTSLWFHQDYLIELNNWPPPAYYASFALMAGTTFCVSLLTGFAIDRWSAIQLLPFFMAPLGGACLVLGSYGGVPAIYLTMLLMGFSYGISSALFGALLPEIYGTRHLGSVRSIVLAFMVFFSAAGPGVTGLLIDAGISFPTQLLFIAGYCFTVLVIMVMVSRRLHARRLRETSASGVELSTSLA